MQQTTIMIICSLLLAVLTNCKGPSDLAPMNVLFIAVDDMNNWIGQWEGLAKTPHIDRLVEEGVAFKNAHCVAPVCNPSRVALFTGQRPETNGTYENNVNFRDREGGTERITLPQFLRSKGYKAVCAGKLYHSVRGTGEKPIRYSDPKSWDYQFPTRSGTPGASLYQDENGWGLWLEGADSFEGVPLTSYLRRSGIWGPIPHPVEECGDWNIAQFGVEFLQQEHEKPFMLGIGIFRPHSPQLAPQKYFDLYPLEDIVMPVVPEDDMDDIPEIAHRNWSTSFARKVKSNPDEWRKAVQGYLASCSFADACVGEVLDALDKSQYRDNTIVVFWTDHGWQLGHKDRWEKHSLWHASTHTPMIIRFPDQWHSDDIVEHVSLLDIYPTVADLLGFEIPGYLEGNSLLPLLWNHNAAWEHRAVVTHHEGNNAVRWKQWNYINHRDGSEELYNHDEDPNEWTNLAGEPQFRNLMDDLKESLPTVTLHEKLD